MELITIKSFNNTIDAHILMARLEDEGIECTLFDENIVSINPLYSQLVGGIKLKVKEEDCNRAIQIVNEISSTPLTDDDNNVIMCPRCDSTDLYSDFKSTKGLRSFISALISLAITVFPFYVKNVYRCKECDCEFEKPKSKRS